ncbi:MAG: FecR domain-containing protein [Candidatus Omnitrophica bacterium]|nr:FecR domain-containing protein [Candidatus Omnitrophota bacterium]
MQKLRWVPIALLTVGLAAGSAWAEVRYAVVVQVEGDPQVQEAGGAWRSLGPGVRLREGDRIRAPSSATAVLAIIDGNLKVGQLKLRENSELILGRMTWEPRTGGSSTLLDIAVGNVLLYTRTQEEGSSFEVKTPVSISGVRGTGFSVGYDPRSRSSETAVYEGIVAVRHLHPSTGEPIGEEILAREGTRARVEEEGGVRGLTPLPTEEIRQTLKEVDELRFAPGQESRQPSRRPILVKGSDSSDGKKGGALARFGLGLLSAGLLLFGLWRLLGAVGSVSPIGFLLALAMIAGGAWLFQSQRLYELNWDELTRLARAAWDELKGYLPYRF